MHRSGRTARAERSGTCVTFYTENHLYKIKEIEKASNIKFIKVGVPQPIEVVKAQAESVSFHLKGVNSKILKYYKETVADILKELSPSEALERAFAYMCG